MAALAQELISRLDQVDAETLAQDHATRIQLVNAARRLVDRLEYPIEQTINHTITAPLVSSAIRTLIGAGIWEAWNDGEMDVADLAKIGRVGIDENLLRRLLRLLGAANVITETAEDRYKPTPFSLDLGDESTGLAATFRCYAEHDPLWPLHKYLAKTSYKEPHAQHEGYLDIYGEDFWTRSKKDSSKGADFRDHMHSWTRYKPKWTDIIDLRYFHDGAYLKDGSAFVVDIGGSSGGDIAQVLEIFPDVPQDSLVVQDLPEVVAKASLDEKIKVMPYDFFDAQPIIGSRIYFLHAVFHDWSDSDSLRILANIKPAMKKGYSKLLIADIALPRTGASLRQAAMDVQMMSFFSAKERTEQDWEKLLGEAGFKVVKFWKDRFMGNESIVEAELQ